jgi:choline dehydrogenase-like flavoprotein
MGLGETLPYHDNRIYLHETKVDKYGLPILGMNVFWRDNELKMGDDMINEAVEILEKGGLQNVRPIKSNAIPASAVHEMGTARMGIDNKTSVLNKWNQIHAVKNVFVTDGSCMTSSGNQNPSLTYMALTARAANYAVEQLKKGDL